MTATPSRRADPRAPLAWSAVGLARGFACCPGTRCRTASIPAAGSPACGRRKTTRAGLCAGRRAWPMVAGAGRCWRSPRASRLLAPLSRERRGARSCSRAAPAGSRCSSPRRSRIGLRGWTRGLARRRSSASSTAGSSASAPAAPLVADRAACSLLSIGLALRGAFGGDAFVAGSVGDGRRPRSCSSSPGRSCASWCRRFQDGDGAFAPVAAARNGCRRQRSGACAASRAAAAAAWPGTRSSWRCAAAPARRRSASPSR